MQVCASPVVGGAGILWAAKAFPPTRRGSASVPEGVPPHEEGVRVRALVGVGELRSEGVPPPEEGIRVRALVGVGVLRSDGVPTRQIDQRGIRVRSMCGVAVAVSLVVTPLPRSAGPAGSAHPLCDPGSTPPPHASGPVGRECQCLPRVCSPCDAGMPAPRSHPSCPQYRPAPPACAPAWQVHGGAGVGGIAHVRSLQRLRALPPPSRRRLVAMPPPAGVPPTRGIRGSRGTHRGGGGSAENFPADSPFFGVSEGSQPSVPASQTANQLPPLCAQRLPTE